MPFEPKPNIKGFLPLVFTAQLLHCCIINGSNYQCYCVPPPCGAAPLLIPAITEVIAQSLSFFFFFSLCLLLYTESTTLNYPWTSLAVPHYSPLGLCISCLRSFVQFGASISRTPRWICGGSGHSADLSLFVVCQNENISWNTKQARECLQTSLSYLTLICHEAKSVFFCSCKKYTNFDSSFRRNLNSDRAPSAPGAPCSICLLSWLLLGLLDSPATFCCLEPWPPFFLCCPASHCSAEDLSTRWRVARTSLCGRAGLLQGPCVSSAT